MSSSVSGLSCSSWYCNANSYLSEYSPVVLLLAIPTAQLATKMIGHLYEHGISKTVASLAGRAALWIPAVRQKFEQKMEAQLKEFQISALKKWQRFDNPYVELPEKGVSFEELSALIFQYAKATEQPLAEQHFSGAIYSASLKGPEEPIVYPNRLPPLPVSMAIEEREAAELRRLYCMVFENSYLWNPLHGKEFAVGSFIHFQLIQIIGSLYGGRREDIAGFVTSGGTESLMTAAKGYVEWGMREKGLKRENCVILAPDSIHAGLDKAAADIGFKLVKAPTDENGHVQVDKLRALANRYRSQIVAIFGSQPSYPKGKIDPIYVMGEMGGEFQCGVHVDCCLGSLVDMQWKGHAPFLALNEITSLSADPHKNGGAPKGVSVLVTKKMPQGKNLAFYSIYSNPGWQGGIYGTPTKAGSQSCVPAFTALIALLKRGRAGFERMGRCVHATALEMGLIIAQNKQLKLLGEVEANVIAFKIREGFGYEKGAIYAFTKLMEDHGFSCSNIADESAHFCVTERCVSDRRVLNKFRRAVTVSLRELENLNHWKRDMGKEFPGEAGIYGEIGAALYPKKEELSRAKYAENLLFGEVGAEFAVRNYFLANANPLLKA